MLSAAPYSSGTPYRPIGLLKRGSLSLVSKFSYPVKMMIINALLRNKRFCYVANCNFWREEQRSVSICQGIRRELSRVAVLESLEEVLVLYLFDMFGVAEMGFVGKPDCLYIGSSEGLGGGTHFPNEEARTERHASNTSGTLCKRLRGSVLQGTIAHALEKTKYDDSDAKWKEFESKYHFSCQFTADLISMNATDFIITSTYQEIANEVKNIGTGGTVPSSETQVTQPKPRFESQPTRRHDL
ncbi:hypothetical protein Syun_022471 [Stephania yunnanensis]|uniref:sucrose synthase n=1 Tax=Stephania yunnanensis TaxID=152371 RepID=A0AAP0F9K6_9MAGN